LASTGLGAGVRFTDLLAPGVEVADITPAKIRLLAVVRINVGTLTEKKDQAEKKGQELFG
jgi:hypothetical protein